MFKTIALLIAVFFAYKYHGKFILIKLKDEGKM
jgi:hypothetical protein